MQNPTAILVSVIASPGGMGTLLPCLVGTGIQLILKYLQNDLMKSFQH